MTNILISITKTFVIACIDYRICEGNVPARTIFKQLLPVYQASHVCPIPVKTDVGQVDLVLRLSNGRSEKIRFPNVPVRRTNLFPLVCCIKEPFDLQFVHNLFWLKLKWNARSKLFYCIIYRSSRHALMKFKDIDTIKVAISETLTEISIFEI